MILCELVPRDEKEFLTQALTIRDNFPQIAGINIPDVLRLDTRSYDAAEMLLSHGIDAVPHIRTIDLPLEGTLDIISKLVDKGLKQVLIVTGDMPISISAKTYPVTPAMMIQELRQKHPELKVYAAIDPYRQSFQKELTYCREKIRAGAHGFFSQPFFDKHLSRIFSEQLPDTDFFTGISPVTSEGSYNYWITRNKAIFPTEFELTLEYNCQLGREIIEMAESQGNHVYLMPIKVHPIEYLQKLFV
jgi:methylenetetrahydrofolate reductase (NADPH)